MARDARVTSCHVEDAGSGGGGGGRPLSIRMITNKSISVWS